MAWKLSAHRSNSDSRVDANWRYNDDLSGITFFYFRDEEKTVEVRYTVTQLELDFWDKLTRVTAYAAFHTIHEQA